MYIDISETLKSQIQMFVFIIVLFIRHTSAEINEVLNNEPSIETKLLVIRMIIAKGWVKLVKCVSDLKHSALPI